MTTTTEGVVASAHGKANVERAPRDFRPFLTWTAAALAAGIFTVVPWLLLGTAGAMIGAGTLVGIAMVAVALRRFAIFLVLVLLVRPVLDHLKFGTETSLFELTSLLSLLFLVAGVLWLLAQREANGPAPLTVVWLITTAMAMFYLLSTATSLHPSDSLTPFVKLASWFVMFLVVRRFATTEKNLRTLLIACAACAVLPLFFAYYELITPGQGSFWEIRHGLKRLTSTFNLGNNFGRFLMLFTVSGVALASAWQVPPTTRSRVITRLGLLALPIPFYFTFTRAAWIGVAVGVLVVFVVQDRRLAPLLMVAVALLAFAVPSAPSAIQTAARPEQTEYTNDSVAWRYQYWSKVIDLTKGHEQLGIGPGSLVLEGGKEAHNEYLRAFIENGVAGLTALLALIISLFLAAVRVARDRLLTPLRRGFGAAGAGVTAAVAAAGAASNIFDSISFMWYFAVLMGVVDASLARSRAAAAPAVPSESISNEQAVGSEEEKGS